MSNTPIDNKPTDDDMDNDVMFGGTGVGDDSGKDQGEVPGDVQIGPPQGRVYLHPFLALMTRDADLTVASRPPGSRAHWRAV